MTTAAGSSTPPAARSPPARMTALAITSGVLAALTVVRLVLEAVTRNRLLLDHPSGAWATLADDLLHGTFYRPIESALGWGGTRYPPLHPLLRAGLARLGPSVAGAGALLEALSLLVLVVSVLVLLERLGVGRRLALPGALMVLGLVPVQSLLGLGKGDLTATALSLGGLALATRARRRRGEIGIGLLFALAVLTKWTVLGGMLAWAQEAWLSGRRRLAVERLVLFAALLALGVLAADLASQGRMLEQLRSCAGGGGSVRELLSAPTRFLVHADGADLALLLLAAGALAAGPRGAWQTLPVLFLGWTLACTVAVFGSPGIAENHLLDLAVAALVALLFLVDRGALPPRFAAVALPLYVVLCVSRVANDVGEGFLTPRPAEVLALTGSPAEGPLLTENPWVALLGGERPVLPDPFTFRILSQKRPELGAHLLSDLEARRFRAVVLRIPVDTDYGREWYRITHYGPGFVEALTRNYERVASLRTAPRPYWTHDVWRPRR